MTLRNFISFIYNVVKDEITVRKVPELTEETLDTLVSDSEIERNKKLEEIKNEKDKTLNKVDKILSKSSLSLIYVPKIKK